MICSKYAPFLFDLVVTTKVRYLVAFIVPVGILLIAVVPFDGAVAVAGYEIVGSDWFPREAGGGIATQARCVADL